MTTLLHIVVFIICIIGSISSTWPIKQSGEGEVWLTRKQKLDRLHRAASTDPPNFIIFFVDDLGYYDVSYNGHPTTDTPNIDKLAFNGMRLTQWYTGQPVCSPSRAAMLTGRLPVRTGCAGIQQCNYQLIFPL